MKISPTDKQVAVSFTDEWQGQEKGKQEIKFCPRPCHSCKMTKWPCLSDYCFLTQESPPTRDQNADIPNHQTPLHDSLRSRLLSRSFLRIPQPSPDPMKLLTLLLPRQLSAQVCVLPGYSRLINFI